MLRYPGKGKFQHRLIVSLCDYSGRWSQPYRDAGYEVRQYDLKHGSDVRLIKKIDDKVHGVLFAPVCTEFSGAGAKHWKAKEAAGNKALLDGLALVDAGLRFVFVHRPEWWVLENPVGRLKDWIGYHRHTFNPNEYAGYLGDAPTGRVVRKPKTIVGADMETFWSQFSDDQGVIEDAWMEDAYTKRTCLWGDFAIPDTDGRPAIWGSKMWASYGGKSERTKELRSMTPRGFSRAFFTANP